MRDTRYGMRNNRFRVHGSRLKRRRGRNRYRHFSFPRGLCPAIGFEGRKIATDPDTDPDPDGRSASYRFRDNWIRR